MFLAEDSLLPYGSCPYWMLSYIQSLRIRDRWNLKTFQNLLTFHTPSQVVPSHLLFFSAGNSFFAPFFVYLTTLIYPADLI